jgi:hypothetical protein
VREAVVVATTEGTTVVVEPIFPTLERWAQGQDISFATRRGLVRTDEVIEHLREDVVHAGAEHGLQAIDRFIVLDAPIDSVPGALSSSGRVRRDVVLEAAQVYESG